MQLVSARSLSETIDRVNHAYFYGALPGKEARAQATKMILSRAGAPSSYRGNTFGLTQADERGIAHTFTGEGLPSPASRKHIHAEEACRCLIILNTEGRRLSGLDAVTDNLLDMLRHAEADGKAKGTFCCGPCTVALWRHMAVNGLGDYAKNLNAGLAVLGAHQDGKGAWKRFPFFYTLSALAEVPDLPNARRAIKYALPECEKRVRRLKPSSEFSRRRRDLLVRVLEA